MEYPKMRRQEKQLPEKKAYDIINKAPYGVLSLSAEGFPYGIPLSHAMHDGVIYFHCAKEGFKLDIIAKNPNGHFVFVSKAKTKSEKATVDYKSAMAYGKLRIVEDADEKRTAYTAIVQKYMADFPKEAKNIITKSDHKTAIVAMDIEGISAKGTPKTKKDKPQPSKIEKTNDKKKIRLKSPIVVNGINIKNRIVMPPLVRLTHKRENGMLSDDDYKYYAERAKNETGLIVVEATAVDESGLTFKNGLRLWDDSYIAQFKKLTDTIKKHGAKVFIQLQHGGYKASLTGKNPVSASDYDDGRFTAKGMSEKEADRLVEQFAKAALRAKKAGFDGVELHACHGYLINQFSCPQVNRRTDKYAKSSEFGCAVIKMTKELCGNDFIVSVRTGVNSPKVKNSVKTAMDYERAGADMLSVSAGICHEPYKAPEKWKYSDISHMAYIVKKKVSVPVIGVYGITSRKIASSLIKKGYMDMAAVGRGHLIHPDWAKRALNREEISECRLCSKCFYFGKSKKCPAVESAKKKGLI